jgi:2-dehydro-3-deoxy-D-arabinonate dehydratase
MKLFRTTSGVVAATADGTRRLPAVDWDVLLNMPDLQDAVTALLANADPIDFDEDAPDLLPPIGSQEIWAAGVTYYRSRVARMEESETAAGGDFYDKVYHAERPEIFFKGTPNRVAGHRQNVRIRGDATWNIPEPELTLVINCRGEIIGYTIGNDMSSRDIEGANPLYLPQAKVYHRSSAIGPGILLQKTPLPPSTTIALEIARAGDVVFAGDATLEQMKRMPEELVEYLFREDSFPCGAFLMTGTCIVPPNDFTLQSGDEVRITIEPIGTLINTVA